MTEAETGTGTGTGTGITALVKLNLSLLPSTCWELQQSGGVGKMGLVVSGYIGEEQ